MSFIRDTRPRFEEFKRELRPGVKESILVPSYLRQCVSSPEKYKGIVEGLGIITLNGNDTTDFPVDPEKTAEAHALIAERSPRIMAALATGQLYVRQEGSLVFVPITLEETLSAEPSDYLLGRHTARFYAIQTGLCREEWFAHSMEMAEKKAEVVPFYKQKHVEMRTGQIDDPFIGLELYLLDEFNGLKERKPPKKKPRIEGI